MFFIPAEEDRIQVGQFGRREGGTEFIKENPHRFTQLHRRDLLGKFDGEFTRMPAAVLEPAPHQDGAPGCPGTCPASHARQRIVSAGTAAGITAAINH